MSKESQCTRSILFNTGIYLIIDFSSRLEPQLVNNIIEILSDTLAIAYCSKGVSRIPYFGLGVINSQFDVVWKFSRLKKQYNKIIQALSTLKKIAESANLTDEDFFDYIHMSVKQVLSQLDSLSFIDTQDNMDSCNGVKPNVNIMLLTKKDSHGIRFFLKSLLEQFNHQRLGVMQVIELCDKYKFDCIKDGIIHSIQMNSSVENIEKLFKSWLVNLNFDREDLILKISDVEVKCDLQEILINPLSLPFSSSFHLHKDIIHLSPSLIPDPVMPVYVLEVVERISSSGISESSVFGAPMQIRATQVHKSAHHNYYLNLQRFNSLCKVLSDVDEYLIAKLITNNTPNSYFVLMPGDEMFLIKSITSREMLLPLQNSAEPDHNNNQLLYQVKLEMSNILFGLKLSDEYNPDKYQSGICRSLRNQLQSRNNNSKEKSLYEELDHLQSKSSSFNQTKSLTFKVKKNSTPTHQMPSTSKTKKQKLNHTTKDINLIKHLGALR